jgi:hypothetical protein
MIYAHQFNQTLSKLELFTEWGLNVLILSNAFGKLCCMTRKGETERHCIPDVFVRLSTSDNIHQGANAVGVKTKASDKVLAEADRALLRLFLGTPSRVEIIGKNSTAAERDQEAAQYITGIGASTKLTDKWSGQQLVSRKTQVTSDASGAFKGVLMTRYIDIGSTEEQLEMLAVQESAKATSLKLPMKHKIYRRLDSRRYSMYFNRWYASPEVADRHLIVSRTSIKHCSHQLYLSAIDVYAFF